MNCLTDQFEFLTPQNRGSVFGVLRVPVPFCHHNLAPSIIILRNSFRKVLLSARVMPAATIPRRRSTRVSKPLIKKNECDSSISVDDAAFRSSSSDTAEGDSPDHKRGESVQKRRRITGPRKRMVKKAEDREVDLEDIAPPPNWQAQFEAIREFRRTGAPAAVDTMGCDIHDHVDPRTRRLHCLVSLMLSAQCKDEANALVMAILKRTLPHGLTLDDLLEIEQAELALLIRPSGMHNRKAEYIKKTAIILKNDFNGDVPDTADGMMSLPGVGPKMAMLCMGSAWDQVVGIGVDTHVHRICNLLGWVDTNAPEKTRKALESWLPKTYWREINHMLVGHGQLTCRPIGRKCSRCPLSQDGILRCPSVVARESSPSKKKIKTERLVGSNDRQSYESRFPKTQIKQEPEDSKSDAIPLEAKINGETGTELDRVPEEKMNRIISEVSPYFKQTIKQEP